LEGGSSRVSALDADYFVDCGWGVMAITFLPLIAGRNPGDGPEGFGLFPIAFYAVSFCVMYSLIHVDERDASRRCLNGHAISPLAKFCEECGAPVAPEGIQSNNRL